MVLRKRPNQNQIQTPKRPNAVNRIVQKTGHRNVAFSKIPQRSWRYCKDFVTTLVEQKWKYTLFLFAFSFFASWFAFAVLWYLIGYAHGDLIFDDITGERLSEGVDPCVIGATSFTGIFIYSVESQVSIGYGEKYPSEECPEGIFLFVAQIIVGIAIEGAMVGIVYAKMARPSRTISKLKFSQNATICLRDGQLCLIFRICDPTEQQTIGTKVRAYIFEEKFTKEGESLGKSPREFSLENNGIVFIMWPVTCCHIIDSISPFYDCTYEDLLNRKFEIVVSIVGSSPSTGQLTQSRTSYLPTEILWGYRFEKIVEYDWSKQTYAIDYESFNSTVPIETPKCSARNINEYYDEETEF